MTKKDLDDATSLAAYVEGLYRAAFVSTPDPMYTCWRDHIKHMYQSEFGSPHPYSSEVDYWAEAWKSYKIPQPLVSDLQFPKWRDEKMEEQEKRKQEETDRYFAWLGAKHALQQIQAELEAARAADKAAIEARAIAQNAHKAAEEKARLAGLHVANTERILASAQHVCNSLTPVQNSNPPRPPK